MFLQKTSIADLLWFESLTEDERKKIERLSRRFNFYKSDNGIKLVDK